MSGLISTASKPECVWTVRSWIYSWFIDQVVERYESDVELASELSMANDMNGISLELTYADNPVLAKQITEAMLSVAREVAAGDLIRESDGSQSEESLSEQKRGFSELCRILEAAEWMQ